MKDRLRRMLAIMLSVMMLFSNLPVSAIAEGIAEMARESQSGAPAPADKTATAPDEGQESAPAQGESENERDESVVTGDPSADSQVKDVTAPQEDDVQVSDAFQLGVMPISTKSGNLTLELLGGWNVGADTGPTTPANSSGNNQKAAYTVTNGQKKELQANDTVRFWVTLNASAQISGLSLSVEFTGPNGKITDGNNWKLKKQSYVTGTTLPEKDCVEAESFTLAKGENTLRTQNPFVLTEPGTYVYTVKVTGNGINAQESVTFTVPKPATFTVREDYSIERAGYNNTSADDKAAGSYKGNGKVQQGKTVDYRVIIKNTGDSALRLQYNDVFTVAGNSLNNAIGNAIQTLKLSDAATNEGVTLEGNVLTLPVQGQAELVSSGSYTVEANVGQEISNTVSFTDLDTQATAGVNVKLTVVESESLSIGYSLSINSASFEAYKSGSLTKGVTKFNTSDGIELVFNDFTSDQHAQKWLHTDRYNAGETITITKDVPVSTDNYVFLAWFDKKSRAGNEFVHSGETVIKDGSGTQTLDAVWAHLNIENEIYVYDGTERALEEASIELAGETGEYTLDGVLDRFMEDTRFGYTVKKKGEAEVLYEDDELALAELKHLKGFTEVGTYVYDLDVTFHLNGETKQKFATAELTILPRPIVVQVNEAEYPYNTMPHTVEKDGSEYVVETALDKYYTGGALRADVASALSSVTLPDGFAYSVQQIGFASGESFGVKPDVRYGVTKSTTGDESETAQGEYEAWVNNNNKQSGGITIKNSAGNDMTRNYVIIDRDGKLKITKPESEITIVKKVIDDGFTGGTFSFTIEDTCAVECGHKGETVSVTITLNEGETTNNTTQKVEAGHTYTVTEVTGSDWPYTVSYEAIGEAGTDGQTVVIPFEINTPAVVTVSNTSKYYYVEHYIIDLNTDFARPISTGNDVNGEAIAGNDQQGKPEVEFSLSAGDRIYSYTRVGTAAPLEWSEGLTYQAANEQYKDPQNLPSGFTGVSISDQGITSGNAPYNGGPKNSGDTRQDTSDGESQTTSVYTGVYDDGTSGAASEAMGGATLGLGANEKYIALHANETVPAGGTVQVYWVRSLEEKTTFNDGLAINGMRAAGEDEAIRQGKINIQTHYWMLASAEDGDYKYTKDGALDKTVSVPYRWQGINKADFDVTKNDTDWKHYIIHSAVVKQWDNKKNTRLLDSTALASGSKSSVVKDAVTDTAIANDEQKHNGIDNAWQNETAYIYLAPLIKVEYYIDNVLQTGDGWDSTAYTINRTVRKPDGFSAQTNSQVGEGKTHPYTIGLKNLKQYGEANSKKFTTDNWVLKLYDGDKGTELEETVTTLDAEANLYHTDKNKTELALNEDGYLVVRLYAETLSVTIHKTVVDDSLEDGDEATFDFTLKPVTDASGNVADSTRKSVSVRVKVTADAAGQATGSTTVTTTEGLQAGWYAVVENAYDDYITEYATSETGPYGSSVVVEVKADGTADVYVRNTRKKTAWTVSKKVADKDGAELSAGAQVKVGDKLTYTIKVTNTGNETIGTLYVADAFTGNKNALADKEASSDWPEEESRATCNSDFSEIYQLKPNETMTITYTYVVQAQDTAVGNVVVVENDEDLVKDPTECPDGEEDHQKNHTGSTSVTVEAKPAYDASKSVTSIECPNDAEHEDHAEGTNGKIAHVGDTITYVITVKNEGNTELTNIPVTDKLNNADIDWNALNTAGRLTVSTQDYSIGADNKTLTLTKIAIGATVTITYTYTVEAVDAQLVNVAVVGTDDDNTTTTEVEPKPAYDASKSATITACADTNATEDAKQKGHDGKAHVGDTITYVITVKNEGNTELTNIPVTDKLNNADIDWNALNTAGRLTVSTQDYSIGAANKTLTLTKIAIGATVTITYTYTVEAADVKLVNAAVVGTDDDNTTTTEVEPKPAYDASKSATITVCADANATEDAKQKGHDGKAHVGDTITYVITVKNEGNTELTNIPVTDKLNNADIDWNALKAAGKLTVSTQDYSIDADNKTLTLTKIAIGATVTITYTYTVEATDAQLINVAVVGTDNDNTTTTDVELSPSLSVVKTASKIVAAEKDAQGQNVIVEGAGVADYTVKVGDKITYTITVTNTGNVTLESIKVTDPWAAMDDAYTNDVIETIASLAPGASVDVTFTHEVTQEQIDGSEATKKLTNTATATAQDPRYPDDSSKTVTGQNDETVKTNPTRKFTAVKTIPEAYDENGHLKSDFAGYKVGDVVEFEIVVTNTGDVTLKNVTVSEKNASLAGVTIKEDPSGLYTVNDDAATIKEIKPGESVTVKATYTVTSLGTEMTNIATVTDPEDKEHPKTPEVKVPRKAWTVSKSVKGMTGSYVNEKGEPVDATTEGAVHSAREGDVLEYTITVKNTGDVTLSSLKVADEMLPKDANEVEFSKPEGSQAEYDAAKGEITNLGKGEEVTLTYTYTVQAGDKTVANTVTVSSGTDPNPPSSSTTTPVENWKVEKTLATVDGVSKYDPEDVKADAVLVYEITVTNTGDVELSGLTIGDDLVNLGDTQAKTFDVSKLAISTKAGANEGNAKLDSGVINKLPAGKSITLTYTYTVQAGDTFLTNVASASKPKTPEQDPEDPDNPPTPEDTTKKSEKVETVVYIQVQVTKSWLGGDSNEMDAGLRDQLLGRNGISAVLYQGDAPFGEKELKDSNGWTATFTDLPAAYKNGETPALYTYTVKEKANGADECVGDGGTLTLGDYTFSASVTGGRKAGSANFEFTLTNALREQTPSEPTKDATTESGDPITDGVQVGDVITYTITRKSHLTTASTATIVDELPDGLTFDEEQTVLYTVTVNGTDVTQGLELAQDISDDGKTITWTIKNVPPMATVTITYQATVNELALVDGKVENTAKVGFGDPKDDGIFKSDTKEVDVLMPKLSIVKSADVKAVKPGDEIVYTLTVTNSGDGKAKDVVVVDTLPRQVTLVANSFEKKVGDGFVPANGEAELKQDGEITWNVGDVEAGDTAVLRFTVKVKTGGTGHVPGGAASLTNIAEITEGLPPQTPEKDSKSSVVTPVADVSIVKTGKSSDPAVNGKYEIGAVITFTLKVKNIGAVDLQNVTVSDDHFEGAKKDASGKAIITLTDADGNEKSLTLNGDTVEIGDLAAGKTVTITYDYVVTEADVSDTKPIINTATVNAKYPKDPNDPDGETEPTTPRSDTETMPASPKPAWLVTKDVTGMTGPNGQVGGTRARVGDELTYTITVENTGTVKLENIVITDAMFAKAKEGSIQFAIDGVAAKTPEITNNTLTIPVLEIGEKATITYTYVVTKGDMGKPLDNTAKSRVPKLDGSTGDEENQYEPDDEHPDRENPSEDSTNTPVENWSVQKLVGVTGKNGWRQLAQDEGVKVGTQLVYHIVVTNQSSHTLSGLKVKDVFEGQTLAASDLKKVPDALGSKYGVVNGEGVIDNLPAGKSITLEYRYTVTEGDAGTMLTNAVTVGGDDGPSSSVDTPVIKYAVEKDATVKHQSDCHDLYETIAHVGDTIEYTITVSNQGVVPLTNLKLSDVFTAGNTDLSDKLVWADGSDPSETFNLDVNGVKTFTATYTVEATTEQLANVASVGDVSSDEVTTDVEAWEIAKSLTLVNDAATDADTKVKAGDELTYTITVTNTGSVTLDDLNVADVMSGMTGSNAPAYKENSFSAPEGSEATYEDGAISRLAAGETVTLCYTYEVQPGDAFLSNVAIAGKGDPSDPNHKEESDPVKTVVYADVSVKKVWKDGSGKALDPDVLDLLLTSETEIEVELLRNGAVLTTLKLTKENGWAQKVSQSLPMADAQSGKAYVYTVREVGEKNGRATINGYTFAVSYSVTRDADSGDVEATVTNKLATSDPDDGTEKSARVLGTPGSGSVPQPDQDFVENGDLIKYTITRTSSLSTTTTATIKDILPEGLDFVENSAKVTVMVEGLPVVNGEAITGSVSGRSITWTVKNVPPMGTVSITYQAKVNGKAFDYDRLINKAEVGFEKPDGSIDFDDDTAELNVSKPKLRITKTASVDAIRPGGEFYYTLRVDNYQGEGKATNVVVKDTLPKYLELDEESFYKNSSNAEYDQTTREITWTISLLEAKIGVASLRIPVKVIQNAGDYLKDGSDYPKGFKNTAIIDDVAEGKGTIDQGNDDADVKIADVLITKKGADDKGDATGQEVKDRYVPGDRITYTVTIENIWNVDLKNVTISDAMFAKALDADGNGIPDIWVFDKDGKWFSCSYSAAKSAITLTDTFKAGEKVTITYVYVVTQEDVDRNKPIVNTAFVDAEYDMISGGSAKDRDKSNSHSASTQMPALPQPGLQISKSVSLTASDGTASQQAKTGDTLTYTIVVQNTGNVTLKDIVITDEMFREAAKFRAECKTAKLEFDISHITDEGVVRIASMPYGCVATLTYTCPVTEKHLAKGEIVNVAAVTGTDPSGDTVPGGNASTETPTELAEPKLTIEKTVTNTPVDGAAFAEGETIRYRIEVKNEGNITITDVVVVDPLTGDRWEITRLLPGTSRIFTARHTVTSSEASAGRVTNSVTAKGKAEGRDLAAIDSVDSTTKQTPPKRRPGGGSITPPPTTVPSATYSMSKSVLNVPSRGYFVEGESVTFNITVKNTGTVTIYNFTVSDLLAEAKFVPGSGYTVTGNQTAFIWTLQPGQSIDLQVRYTITAKDVGRGSVRNVAVGTGSGPDGSPAIGNSAEASAPANGRTFKVTVHYVYQEDGTTAAPDEVRSGLSSGDIYDILSAYIEGYWASKDRIEGTMMSQDLEFTVFYVRNELEPVPLDEFGVPLNVGYVTMNVGDCFE